MRRQVRNIVRVRGLRCGLAKSLSGAVSEVELPDTEQRFKAAVHPIDQRRWRDPNSLRPRERRLVIPEGGTTLNVGDHLYMEGEQKCFRCTEVRRYALHTEVETEAMP